MSKTDEAVANIVTKGGEKLADYIGALSELTKQYAPDVLQTGLTVIRLNGVQDAIYGVLGIFLLIISAIIVYKAIRKGILQAAEHKGFGDPDGFGWVFGGVIGGIFSLIGSLALAFNAFSIWTWVAIFDPKLYIAYKIMGKFF